MKGFKKRSKEIEIMKVTAGKEIVIRILNEIGVLAEITKSLSERGISFLALSAWVEGADGVIHLVTDDNVRAMDLLHSKFQAREANVLIAELAHKPGMLKRVAESLKAEGIDIHHLYATALPEQNQCLTVFSTSYNDQALRALQGLTHPHGKPSQ
jgi:hypothetical protein